MKTVTLAELETVDAETGDLNVVIETPSGCRNKFAYDPKNDLFKLKKTLPAGMVFPMDFGFIPSTLAADGDPMDVLVLMDQPAYPGNLVTARLIGAIEAEQSEGDGRAERNDRLVAVATECQDYKNVKALDDLDDNVVVQIEQFFVNYNRLEGKKFKLIGRTDARLAGKLLDEGRKRFVKARQE